MKIFLLCLCFATGLRLIAAPAPPAGIRPLIGCVVTPTGVPVTGASVWQPGRPGNLAVTNTDGCFLLPAPDAAAFTLRVEATGFRRQDRLVTDTTARPMRVVLFPLDVVRRR